MKDASTTDEIHNHTKHDNAPTTTEPNALHEIRAHMRMSVWR